MKRCMLLVALLLTTTLLGIGCTTTVLNSGTDSSATYRFGRLTAEEGKDISSVYAATEAAVDELGLSTVQKMHNELEAKVVARDGQDKKTTIQLISLTKDTTQVKVYAGSRDKAQRIYETIHDKL